MKYRMQLFRYEDFTDEEKEEIRRNNRGFMQINEEYPRNMKQVNVLNIEIDEEQWKVIQKTIIGLAK